MFDTFFGKKKILPKEGKWKEFNKHAVLISVGNYLNDNKHGHWQEFYDTGELMFEEHYEHGVQHGLFASYHRNGNLLSEGMFLWGSREGYFKVFNEDGIHIKSLLFFENKLIEEIDKTRTNIVAECRESEDWLPVDIDNIDVLGVRDFIVKVTANAELDSFDFLNNTAPSNAYKLAVPNVM